MRSLEPAEGVAQVDIIFIEPSKLTVQHIAAIEPEKVVAE